MCDCKNKLTEFEKYVICEKGTEPAFDNEYWDNKTSGVYKCKCCGAILFSSEYKYDSKTGWPSFYFPVGKILEFPDYSDGVIRVEITCGNCGGHLGHLFGDGPLPTGLRYCVNSASLIFEEKIFNE